MRTQWWEPQFKIENVKEITVSRHQSGIEICLKMGEEFAVVLVCSREVADQLHARLGQFRGLLEGGFLDGPM